MFSGVCSVDTHQSLFHRCARTAIPQSASHREASVDTGTELMAALSTPPFGPRRYRPGSLGAGPGVPANGVCFVGPGPAPSGTTARLVAVQAVVWLWPSRQQPAVRSSRRTHSSSSATLLRSGRERLAEEPLSALPCPLRRWACRTWPLGLAWKWDVEDEEEKKKMNYSDETINRGPPCVYAYKINDHMRTCSGWWKHQNNSACTKSVSLQNIGLYTEEEKDEVNKVFKKEEKKRKKKKRQKKEKKVDEKYFHSIRTIHYLFINYYIIIFTQ